MAKPNRPPAGKRKLVSIPIEGMKLTFNNAKFLDAVNAAAQERGGSPVLHLSPAGELQIYVDRWRP